MKKILFIFLTVFAFAEVPFEVPQNVTLEKLPMILNVNFEYLDNRSEITDNKITAVSTGIGTAKTKKHRHYARQIRTEQKANMTDDDVQGQIWDLDDDKLSRVAGHAKSYRTVVGSKIFFSTGATDSITLDGTLGQSEWRGSMVHRSTDSYWTTGDTTTIKIDGDKSGSFYTSISSNTTEDFENLDAWNINEGAGITISVSLGKCQMGNASATNDASIRQKTAWDLSTGRNSFKVFFNSNLNASSEARPSYDTVQIGWGNNHASPYLAIEFIPYALEGVEAGNGGSIKIIYGSNTKIIYENQTSAGIPYIDVYAELTVEKGTITYKINGYNRDSTAINISGSFFDENVSYGTKIMQFYIQGVNGIWANISYLNQYRFLEDSELYYAVSKFSPVINISIEKRGLGLSAGDYGEFLFTEDGGLAIKNKKWLLPDWNITGSKGGRLSLYNFGSAGIDFYIRTSNVPVSIVYDTDGRIKISTTTAITGDLHISGNEFTMGYSSTTGNDYTIGNEFTTGYSSATTYYGDGSNLTNLPQVSTATYAINAGTAVYADNAGLLNGRSDYALDTVTYTITGEFTVINSSLTDIHNNYATDSEVLTTTAPLVTATELYTSTNTLLSRSSATATYVFKSGDTMSGSLIVNANVTVDDLFILGNITVQVLAATSTILSADSFYNISSTADIVMASTPTIASGTDGQFLILQNTGTFYIDIQDDAVLAGSGVFYGGSNAVISPKDIITFLYDSAIGGWVIQSHPNLQVAGASADVILVRNTSGATIPALSAVYAEGYNVGQHRILIGLADADDPSKMPAFGLTPNSIADGANGTVVISGIIEINLSAYSLYDILYASTVAGGLTNAKPTVDAIQALAIVTRAHTKGSLLVTGAGRTNDVPINFTANIVTVSSLTITGANVILKATATHSLNSGLLNGKNNSYFATQSDLTETALSTGTNKTAIDTNSVDIASLSISTASNKTLIDTNISSITTLFVDTATNRGLIDINITEIASLEVSTANLASTKLDKSSATATYQNVNQMSNYLTTSSATVSYINVNQRGDFAVFDATTTYNTDLLKSSQTWTGQNTFSKINYEGFVSTAGDTMSGDLNMIYEKNIILDGGYFSGTVHTNDIFSVSGNITISNNFDMGGHIDMNNYTITEISTTPLAGHATAKEYVDYTVRQSTANVDADLLDGLDSLDFIKKDGSVAFTGTINTNNQWISGDGGAEGIYIADNGDIGIGTASPGYKLEISDARTETNAEAPWTSAILEIHNPNETTNNVIPIMFTTLAGGADSTVASILAKVTDHTGGSANADLYFGTTKDHIYSTKMIIKDSGNVGIGTISPDDKLHIAGNLQMEGSFPLGVIKAMNDAGTGTVALLQINGVDDTLFLGYENTNIKLRTNSGDRMIITSAGDIGIGTNDPNGHRLRIVESAAWSEIDAGQAQFATSSSKKLKKDIEYLPTDIAKFKQLKPVKFKWKTNAELRGIGIEVSTMTSEASTHTVHGLIAEDVNLIYTDMEEGVIEWNKIQAEHIKTTVYLLNKIEQLEIRIAALEAQ